MPAVSSFKLNWGGDELKRLTREKAFTACKSAAHAVLAEAKRTCPVEQAPAHSFGSGAKSWQRRVPGSLRASGRINTFDQGGAVGAYVVFGSNHGRYLVNGIDTYYAPFVELGTPGHIFYGKAKIPIKANPFLRTALRARRGEIKAAFTAARMA